MRYRVMQNDAEIGISHTIVHIMMGENGAYQECSEAEAEGFCVKLPRLSEHISEIQTQDDVVIEDSPNTLYDTVFSLPGKSLKNAEQEATYEKAEDGA